MSDPRFEQSKGASLSHQLIKVGRLINELGLSTVRKTLGMDSITQAHLDLFPHIDFEGTSITDIAQRKGVTKQAISKIVGEMLEMGMLEIKPDPEDGRGKLVFFKTKGPFAIQKGFAALQKIDGSLQEKLGKSEYDSLLKNASKLIETVSKMR